jgi:predicted 2-oxoglutarate/Fe(II)-dependent dioxygenase YbiX
MSYIHLPGALTREFCEELLAFSRYAGFLPATVRSYGTEELRPGIRNNERLDWVDEALAAKLQQLILTAAGGQFPLQLNNLPFVRFGSRLRIYRYHAGQYFKPHKDGHERLSDLESQLTVLAYLNDARGGETVLMPHGPSRREAWIPILPRAGDVLIFRHDMWHEGRTVSEGEKYVLRTDAYYQAKQAQE